MRPWMMVFSLVLSLAQAGCDEEQPTDGVIDDATEAAADEGVAQGPDTTLSNACQGLTPDAAAEQFDAQCEGVTECTVIEDPPPGPCWCAICGQVGAKPRCLKANCQTPGGS